MDYKLLAKQLASYSRIHLGRNKFDELYLKNVLLHKFNEINDNEEIIDISYIEKLKTPDNLINQLNNPFLENEIMGLLTPSPSEVINKFYSLKENSSLSALNYLYDLQIKNNYIQKTAIDKNIKWECKINNLPLEITINLSKPEKDNKDIAKMIQTKNEDKYPKCLLCLENLGYGGNENHPSRGNLRIIPFKLNNEDFFMQYSPYCYYNHHCIVINNEHKPMQITEKTFKHLLDFVDLFEDYFLGSNSDLPIVGGSILTHLHYQGGMHKLPIMYSKPRFSCTSKDNNIKIEYLDWFNSCIRLISKNKTSMIDALEKIRLSWFNYNNPAIDIFNYTNTIRHNSITPIVRKENNEYHAYIILRNNKTNDIHPDGIFHAHKKYHNIKKEGIGLIEAMGLFILPGRLKNECEEIKKLLLLNCIPSNYYDDNPHMLVHKSFIDEIMCNNEIISNENVDELIKNKINETCMHILKNTAVFKNDEKGNKYAHEFIMSLNL